MEIEYLQDFVTLAKNLNFGETAEERHLTQSALTRHIQILERELGTRLFVRSTRKTSLSPFGEWYLPKAEELLNLYGRIQNEQKEYLEQEGNTVAFGIVHSPGLFRIDTVVAGVKRQVPELTLQLIEEDETVLLQHFEKGKFNLCCMGFPAGDPIPYPFIPFFEGHLIAALRRDHPLASQESVALQDLAPWDLIFPSPNSMVNRYVRREFAELGIHPNIMYEGLSKTGISMIVDNRTVAMLPSETISSIPTDELTWVNIDPPVTYICGLLHADPSRMNSGERKCLKAMKQLMEDNKT